MTDRKLFVAMAGNIGSGKTTVAKMISQTYGFELFDEPVIDNRFLRHYYGDMRRWSFTLQMEFLIKRVEHHHLINSIEKSCIQDRTLLEDPEIFAKYLHGLGNMTDQELDLYFDYYRRLTKDIRHPTKVIYLHAPDVELLLERIRSRGREEERGIPGAFLTGLNGYYSSFPQVCRNKYGVDVKVFEITREDIRSGEARARFLDEVGKFLFA
jgi:deoxyadenosine/deoxycytidine kinase